LGYLRGIDESCSEDVAEEDEELIEERVMLDMMDKDQDDYIEYPLDQQVPQVDEPLFARAQHVHCLSDEDDEEGHSAWKLRYSVSWLVHFSTKFMSLSGER
jgi:hypothetical protein